jgi:hypothetical protein
MSLHDELNQNTRAPLAGDTWINEWYATLDKADQRSWDAWLYDDTKHASVMFRVIRSKGYPRTESTFRSWVREQREQKDFSS